MKVALYNLTTTTRWGGVENFVWEVAAQLAGRGYTVEVFGGRGPKELRRAIPHVKVRLFPYVDRDLWRKIPLLGRQYTLTKLLERLSMAPFALPPLLAGRFDVVHIQKPYDLPVGALARMSGAKLLFGCHGKDFWPGDRLFVRFADGSVSASRFNASQVRARYGIDPVVVYNGVDLQRFSPQNEGDEAVLERHGLERSTAADPALLYAGRLVRWKGVEYLIKAVPKLEPASTQVWIAGEGPYRGELESLAARLGVAERVRFLGAVEQNDLAALYRSSAMLVATSFVNETFGIALCEAMACGAPVAASDFGGFREVVEDRVTGLLFRPQDPNDLAAKVNLLLAAPELRVRMGLAGRERVLATFSWEAVADRLEEVYRACTERSERMSRRPLLYVAYPMRLDLSAANAIQTYSTVRELRPLLPGMKLVVPRWLLEPSAFTHLGALHLPRPAVNKLSRLVPWAGWSYIERTLYASMLVLLLALWRALGRGYGALYVRDAVCAAWLSLFKRLHGGRVIYEVHDLEASHPSKASRWPRRLWSQVLPWLDRTALLRADKVVSLTATFRAWLVEQELRAEEDVEVIPDAFDHQVYYPRDTQQCKAELGLPAGAFIVGYAGLTFAYRGLDLLVEAFAEMARDGDLLLLVGGRPEEVLQMRRLAREKGVDRQVVTPGRVDQESTARYLCASDVLAISDTVTDMTASPLKLFDYMAVGKPIVCKDMPALREIVSEEAAVFFPAGSVEHLGSALRALRDDAQRVRRMGEAARALSAAYTYRARAEKIAGVVKQCL